MTDKQAIELFENFIKESENVREDDIKYFVTQVYWQAYHKGYQAGFKEGMDFENERN